MAKNRGKQSKGRRKNSKGFIRQQINKYQKPLTIKPEEQVALIRKAEGLEEAPDPPFQEALEHQEPRLIQCTFIEDGAFVANATEILDWYPSKNGLVVILKPEAQQVNQKFILQKKV